MMGCCVTYVSVVNFSGKGDQTVLLLHARDKFARGIRCIVVDTRVSVTTYKNIPCRQFPTLLKSASEILLNSHINNSCNILHTSA